MKCDQVNLWILMGDSLSELSEPVARHLKICDSDWPLLSFPHTDFSLWRNCRMACGGRSSGNLKLFRRLICCWSASYTHMSLPMRFPAVPTRWDMSTIPSAGEQPLP